MTTIPRIGPKGGAQGDAKLFVALTFDEYVQLTAMLAVGIHAQRVIANEDPARHVDLVNEVADAVATRRDLSVLSPHQDTLNCLITRLVKDAALTWPDRLTAEIVEIDRGVRP